MVEGDLRKIRKREGGEGCMVSGEWGVGRD